MAALRAGAALPLTGRYGPLARQAAHGLTQWATQSGVALDIVDCGERPEDAAGASQDLAGRTDVLFGPYGSGAMRAVATALAGSEAVIWNHGGAAVERTGARIVDVLGAATTYWTGLPAVIERSATVAIVHAETGFGRQVADGAVMALAAAGRRPAIVLPFDERSAGQAASAARDAGADVVVGCGRFEDDVALVRALSGSGLAVGVVAAGVSDALTALGNAVVGTFGPAQWFPDGRALPAGLGPGDDYPAVQAYAAGTLAERAIAAAGTTEPAAVWRAAVAMRTHTVLGPFAVDEDGRQLAHLPVLTRWTAGPSGPWRECIWRPGGRP